MHRPGARAIPKDSPTIEGDDPVTEDGLYRELFSSDFAQVITGLVPDLVAWLSGRAPLPADLVPQTATDAAHGHLNPLDRVQE